MLLIHEIDQKLKNQRSHLALTPILKAVFVSCMVQNVRIKSLSIYKVGTDVDYEANKCKVAGSIKGGARPQS